MLVLFFRYKDVFKPKEGSEKQKERWMKEVTFVLFAELELVFPHHPDAVKITNDYGKWYYLPFSYHMPKHFENPNTSLWNMLLEV